MIMLLADEPNIREVIPFPLTQRAEDLMMGAPADVPEARLKELSLKLNLPKKKAAASQSGQGSQGAGGQGAGGAPDQGKTGTGG
jgi:aspartyl-tRNA synthetase